MKILRAFFIIFFFTVFTILTQIGGIIYLIFLLFNRQFVFRIANKFVYALVKIFLFLAFYSVGTFLIVPLFAKPFGKVPLPVFKSNNLKPRNFLTCFLNRHYVSAKLKDVAESTAQEMNSEYPGIVINYLDANFPFGNSFPLFPHLSHNDGKKLDLAFFYKDHSTGKPSNTTPSPIGYGISEEPKPGEINVAEDCDKKGYWQYSFLHHIIPQSKKQDFVFDADRTKTMINILASQTAVEKIFIEPHLKTRLKLENQKIRFHGCKAVRHDDHVHVQIK